MIENVSIIRSDEHSRTFDEVAEAFASVLGVGLTDFDFKQTAKNQLLFGAHVLPSQGMALDGSCAIYQSEQITPGCRWLTHDYISLLKSNEVWDYSPKNVSELKKLGVNAKFVPILYMPCMTKFKNLPPEQQDIDVLFYGSINPRRVKILDELSAVGLNVRRSFGVYGKTRDDLIARSKVVLNLHQFDDGIFEIFRCAHLFSNSKCVVSEFGSDDDLDKMYENCVHFVQSNMLVDACRTWCENDDIRKALEDQAFECFEEPLLSDHLKGKHHVEAGEFSI